MIQVNNESYQPKLSRVIALIHPSNSSIKPITSTSNLILETMFSAHEACSPESANTIFGRLFGTPCKISIRMIYTMSYL